ncbi:MAG: major facilitator superfamily protein [Hyphomicrobiales bacterium]|jgi:MFS family permease|nr:major facilitator superfamily protein [Hyphomicrobiales bacterium]
MTIRMPPLIKRNMALFALSQSFTGAGMQFVYGLGPLMIISVSGSANLAGLSVALIGLSRFLVSYPIGKITDTYGRKPGILLGLCLALVGTLIVGGAMDMKNLWLLIAGILLFGMGMNAAQQMRVGATDMVPPQMRAQALGYVALGALAGLILSPAVVALSENMAHSRGSDPLVLPWLMLPILIVMGMIVIHYVRPDPKEIGMNLALYYPGYKEAPHPAGQGAGDFSTAALLRHIPTRLAIATNSAAQGNMSIVMVLTSLVLAHHGHSLSAIAMSHVFHSAGMFAFTIPLGKLADRIGRQRVMYPGLVLTIVGAGLVAFTTGYIPITFGTFLVGIGWAAANVAATALLADQVETAARGRAIGTNDSCAGGVSLVLSIITGPLISAYGLPAAGAFAALVAAIPLLMMLAARIKGGERAIADNA